MLNLAEFKTDAEGHIKDLKRHICNQENSGVAKMYQSNLTIALSIYHKLYITLAFCALITLKLIQIG